MVPAMSFQIATVRGIPIRLHFTLIFVFLLLVAQLGPFGVPAGILLFGSVLLHELGHSVVAQRFGIPIARIDLHLLGGTAMMTRSPATPRQEILVAAAGPAVSLALAAGFAALALALGGQIGLTLGGPADLMAYAAIVNLGIGLFNLLPALPMDGGRIFRAALVGRLGDLRGTRIAAMVSRVFGGLFVAAAFFTGSISLGLIGLVLFVLVGHEERLARMRAEAHAYSTGPSVYVPFGPWSHRFGAGAAPWQEPEVVVDVGRPGDPGASARPPGAFGGGGFGGGGFGGGGFGAGGLAGGGVGRDEESFVDPWGRRWVRVRRRYR